MTRPQFGLAALEAQARIDQVMHEDDVIRDLLRSFDDAIQDDGGICVPARRNFEHWLIEASSLVVTMPNMSPRRLLAAFIQLGGVWKDLTATPIEVRKAAGLQLCGLANLIRQSRGLT